MNRDIIKHRNVKKKNTKLFEEYETYFMKHGNVFRKETFSGKKCKFTGKKTFIS